MSVQSKIDTTYKAAWKEDNVAVFTDNFDCRYAAKGGNLAWRINNPGLIKHHSRYAKKNGSIGSWEQFAIFSNPLQGQQALIDWLQSKTMRQSNLYTIAKHYQFDSSEHFVQSLTSAAKLDSKTKLKDFTPVQFEALLTWIEHLCGFTKTGSEEFLLLPKIAAKIECPNKEDLFLVGQDTTLTLDQAIVWIHSKRLDAVIVHLPNGSIHLRSRPRYQMQTLKLTWEQHCQSAGELDLLARSVGEKVIGQCIWGFINGIRNTRDEAIESSRLISLKAGNQQVFSLRNDQFLLGLKEITASLLLKLCVDTPVVKNAIQFLRFLLASSENQENKPAVVVFAHSQGAAIAEHALASLSGQEKQKIRIFTFGGWSFIPSAIPHKESHNYISVADLIPRLGSPNLQYLVFRKFEGLKQGLTEEEIIKDLAFTDAIHDLDCIHPSILEKYMQGRQRFYRGEFEKISNVTVLDSKNALEHSFKNESYQKAVQEIITKYKENTVTLSPKNDLVELLV